MSTRIRAAAALLAMVLLLLPCGSASAASASDPVRTVSVNDSPPLVVPANGIAAVVFTVTLNGPALVNGEQVNVHFASADYCAMGLPSLASADANLTFVAGGPRSHTVTVLVHAESFERPGHDWEMFSVRLSNPVGAVIAKSIGVGTIVDSPALLDDPFFFDACMSKLRWGSLPNE